MVMSVKELQDVFDNTSRGDELAPIYHIDEVLVHPDHKCYVDGCERLYQFKTNVLTNDAWKSVFTYEVAKCYYRNIEEIKRVGHTVTDIINRLQIKEKAFYYWYQDDDLRREVIADTFSKPEKAISILSLVEETRINVIKKWGKYRTEKDVKGNEKKIPLVTVDQVLRACKELVEPYERMLKPFRDQTAQVFLTMLMQNLNIQSNNGNSVLSGGQRFDGAQLPGFGDEAIKDRILGKSEEKQSRLRKSDSIFMAKEYEEIPDGEFEEIVSEIKDEVKDTV